MPSPSATREGNKNDTQNDHEYKDVTAFSRLVRDGNNTKAYAAQPLTCYDYKLANYDATKFDSGDVRLYVDDVSYEYKNETKTACYCKTKGEVVVGGINKKNRHNCVKVKDCGFILENCLPGAKFDIPTMFVIESEPSNVGVDFGVEPTLITCDVIALFDFDVNVVIAGTQSYKNITYTITNHTTMHKTCACPTGQTFHHDKCITIEKCKMQYDECASPKVMRSMSSSNQESCPSENTSADSSANGTTSATMTTITAAQTTADDHDVTTIASIGPIELTDTLTIIGCYCPANVPIWKNGKCITLEECSPTVELSTVVSTTRKDPNNQHRKLYIAAFVGTAIGAALLLIGAIVLCVVLKKREKKETESSKEEGKPDACLTSETSDTASMDPPGAEEPIEPPVMETAESNEDQAQKHPEEPASTDNAVEEAHPVGPSVELEHSTEDVATAESDAHSIVPSNVIVPSTLVDPGPDLQNFAGLALTRDAPSSMNMSTEPMTNMGTAVPGPPKSVIKPRVDKPSDKTGRPASEESSKSLPTDSSTDVV